MDGEIGTMVALDFAGDAVRLESGIAQDAREGARLVEHDRAGGQADLPDAEATRELDDLLHTREVGAQSAGAHRRLVDRMDLGVEIAPAHLFVDLGGHRAAQAVIGIVARRMLAGLARAVKAGTLVNGHHGSSLSDARHNLPHRRSAEGGG